ncbi:MAG: M28 family peptidase [Candidatus Lokiarchaeota archaeon]|nr:M28 family peptidase [Candidatus Lokiarchaeota archaeon]
MTLNVEKISGSRLYDYMLDFIKIGWRRPGTKEAHETAKFILKKFDEFGLESKLEPFEMLLYTARQWKLIIKHDSLPKKEVEIKCLPAWHSQSSQTEGTEAKLAYVGWGTPQEFKKVDVKNKIVLIDSKNMMSFYPTMDFHRAYEKARLNGAVGLISIHDTPPNTIFAEYVTRHQTYKDSNLESGNIPAFRVSYESGEYIKSLFKFEGEITAKLFLEADTKTAMTDNLMGVLPGKDPDDIILVGTHIDSWFDGAIDNAGGNAGFLELADYYSQFKERKKTMIFAGFAGHEVGSIGVIEFAQKHSSWFNKISTFCMIDGFGSKGYVLDSNRKVKGTGLDEAKGLFTTDNQVLFDIIKDAVEKELINNGPLMHVSAVIGPYSDLGPLVANNVPSIMVIGKGIFYHTIEDTADKVLPEHLERTTRAHVQILNELHKISSKTIREADRKGIILPSKKIKSELKESFVDFDVTPNPPVKGTTTLMHLTSYITNNRIIVDLQWFIDDKLIIHAPVCPYVFRKPGNYEVKLTLMDHKGNNFSKIKNVQVNPKDVFS